MIKHHKKWIVILAALSVLLLLAGCGSDTQTADEETTAAAEEATADEAQETDQDGQNPIMNYIGPYVCDRALIMIEAEGEDGAKVSVQWSSSASEDSEWSMTGTFDPKEKTIEYHNCVKNDVVYDEDGSVEAEEVYTGGHGFLTFGKDGTLTWQDDQEHVADDMTFEFDPDAV